MAAGQGKRMKNPDMAKVMHALAGRPLIDHVVERAASAGAGRIIVVVGHQREAVMAHLRTSPVPVECAVQDPQLGTGHAVLQAEPLLHDLTGDLLVLSGDAPLTRLSTLQRMLDHHRREAAAVTVLTASLPDPTGYGRVVRNAAGHIERIVEHRDATEAERAITEINSGIYVFQSAPLFEALHRVTNDNAQGEYYLPDVFALFARDGRVMAPCHADSFDEIRGVNTVEQLADMERLYRAMYGA